MASINEGFVGDDDKKKLESTRTATAEPQTNVIREMEIDYSKAKNAPIIGAALSGK